MEHFENGTKSYVVETEDDIKKFIYALVIRTISFFEEEVNIKVIKGNYEFHKENYVNFKSLTSIIAIKDCLNITVVFNYDDTLLKETFMRYTKDIIVEDSEIEIFIDETAKDLINNVIGNVLSQFGQPNIIFDISTPMIIKGPEYIAKLKSSEAYTTKIKTEFGQMWIFCIIPGYVFLNEICNIEGEYPNEKS